ncbi:MAG: glycosyltransferase [Opitutaceae bacterium]
MKIAHIVPSLEQRHGGPSKSVRELAAAQARLGRSVELFATGPDDGAAGGTHDGIAARLYSRDWPESFCVSRGLRSALRAAAPDIVHHHALWLRTLHYAHKAARGGDLVISPRGMMSGWAWNHHWGKKQFARFFIHPGALRGAAGWHATSEKEAAEIRARGFGQPICVAPNGIAAPGADALADARTYWQKACPETSRRPVALYYSRFHRKKRLLELIDVWLERAPEDWLLLIAGIPEEYSVDQLENYVTGCLGSNRIRIFSGAGRPAPYAVASLFLLASHNENFGQCIAEAMASAVPALVTDGTPWAEIQRERIGWCVPWDDYGDAMAEATRLGAEALQERGVRAKTWILREYAWERPARLLAEFYERLLLER